MNPKLKIHAVGGEHIAVRQVNGADDMTRVVGLNATSMELYEQFRERDFELADVVDYLTQHFDVEASVAQHDATQWVEQMRKEWLIID